MEFPNHHRQIVEDLMSGKFILPQERAFEVLRENEDFYINFFKASFNYDLKVNQDFVYLVSDESNETLSRDICIFIALLSYELDRDGKNFLERIQFSEFEMEEIESYFTNSSYIDLILSNKQLKDVDSRKNFINTLNRRNIIEKTADNRFVFTSAHKFFMDFATDIVKFENAEKE
ncbi:MAG: hypothetical protein A3F72_04135 [Bacteroidetes bacterium RIFCSPLOWO2_12_FULL_35_15]|nr:MAG: hypothetical protein A3F72_04135 [Bacteroidetes bacterium RIFCSPLOWO2_12_FULL_35_15]